MNFYMMIFEVYQISLIAQSYTSWFYQLCL